jgi:hypothetical protein
MNLLVPDVVSGNIIEIPPDYNETTMVHWA